MKSLSHYKKVIKLIEAKKKSQKNQVGPNENALKSFRRPVRFTNMTEG